MQNAKQIIVEKVRNRLKTDVLRRFLVRVGETRTPGILLPKQARYQLRYTRII